MTRWPADQATGMRSTASGIWAVMLGGLLGSEFDSAVVSSSGVGEDLNRVGVDANHVAGGVDAFDYLNLDHLPSSTLCSCRRGIRFSDYLVNPLFGYLFYRQFGANALRRLIARRRIV